MTQALSVADRPDAFARCEAWLQFAGGTLTGCTMAAGNAEGGHGLVATRALEAGDLMLSVPAHLLITRASAAAEGLPVKAIPEADLIVLMLTWQRQRGDASSWSGWLPTIPRDFNLPLLWEEAQLSALCCPTLVERVQVQRQEAVARHAALQAALATAPLHGAALKLVPPTFEEYAWGLAALESRGVYLCGVLDAERDAVVPVGDMFNHAPADTASVAAGYDAEARCYCYRATRRVEPGEELCVSYGPHDSLTLVQSYGFVLPANPHARALHRPAALCLEPSDATWLDEHGLGSDCHFWEASGPSWALLGAVRLRQASAAERTAGAAFAILDGEPVSAANEVRTWRELRDLATAQLASWEACEDACADACEDACAEGGSSCATSAGASALAAPVMGRAACARQLALEWRAEQLGLLRSTLEVCDATLTAAMATDRGSAAECSAPAPAKDRAGCDHSGAPAASADAPDDASAPRRTSKRLRV